MSELRKYLLFLRRQKNTNIIKINSTLLMVFAGSFLAGLLTDIFLPLNWYYNVIRAIIALAQGVSIFSLIFIYLEKDKEDDKTLRELLSYRQRVNISIITAFILMFVYAFFVNPESFLYTFLSAVFISVFLGLLTFVRATSQEYVMYSYDITDERDLTSVRLNEEKRRKNKKND